jgi:hypothetical protein
MKHVERLSQREIHRRPGLHRDTIRRALISPEPPSYGPRARRASKLDPFLAEIERLLDGDPTLSGVRIREEIEQCGYAGGKTILDDLLRELRPRFLAPRTFQRTSYRPGELLQFDLCEPRREISVGHGQSRRGFIVTAELPYSRAFAGALVFSKEWAYIAWGMNRCLRRLQALPKKLVWDREGAIHAGGGRRPRRSPPSAAGSASAGSFSIPATARPRVRSSAPTASCTATSRRAACSPTRSISSSSSTGGATGSTRACIAALGRWSRSGLRPSASGCGRCRSNCLTWLDASAQLPRAGRWHCLAATSVLLGVPVGAALFPTATSRSRTVTRRACSSSFRSSDTRFGRRSQQAKAALSPWNSGVSSGVIGVSWRGGRWPPSAPSSGRGRRCGRRRRSPPARWRPTIPRASTARSTGAQVEAPLDQDRRDVGQLSMSDGGRRSAASPLRGCLRTATPVQLPRPRWTRVQSGRGVDSPSLTQASLDLPTNLDGRPRTRDYQCERVSRPSSPRPALS